jgi:fructose-1,6-bisphosphatase/inositol monophosphatase family enzyme
VGPTDEEWLAAFRRATAAQREIFASHQGIEARTEYEGIGEGGDRTLVIDRLCEDTIFAELEKLHEVGHEFTVISEERGTVRYGSPDSPLRVVSDPIDGSLNARRTIPWHSVTIGVAEGDSMADVRLGYVYEFGAGEEFVATAGGGATLDGRPLAVPEGDGLEVISVESNKPERLLAAAQELQGLAYRVRTPGSIAISLAYIAAGRFDGMVTSKCRSVDAAGAQLIAREAGARVKFGEGELAEAPLDLSARYDLAAARTDGDLDVLDGVRRALP